MGKNRLSGVGESQRAKRAPHAQPAGPDPEVEEQELIRNAQRGHHEAFETLLRRHQRRVLSLIGHLVRQPAQTEDLAQQVFLKAYRALPRFDFRSSFGTWLHRIGVNECYDYLRRQRAQKSPAGTEIPVGEIADLERLGRGRTAASGLDLARQMELRQVVERLLARLSAEDRLLLILRELEGCSLAELAQLLGVKEGTVKIRLFRARKRLLDLYERASGVQRTGPRRTP